MDSTARASTTAVSSAGSWDIGDPEEILRRLHRAHPDADRAQLRGIFLDHLSSMVPHAIIRPLGAVFFDARYTYVVRPKPLAAVPQTQTLRDKTRQEVVVAMRGLLNWMMPNGKKLGDCTGRECRKAGGWLTRVAAKVPPRKLVRDVLSDAQLQKLYG